MGEEVTERKPDHTLEAQEAQDRQNVPREDIDGPRLAKTAGTLETQGEQVSSSRWRKALQPQAVQVKPSHVFKMGMAVRKSEIRQVGARLSGVNVCAQVVL